MSEIGVAVFPQDGDEGFQIRDDSAADWALRKMAEADAELQKMTDWYEAQLKAVRQKHDDAIAYFSGILQQYFASVPAKETKTMKKYALPSGELVLSKEKQDFSAIDNEALLGWCQENDPKLVQISMRPAWAEIKKRLTATDSGIIDSETGMIVEGVQLINKPEEFKVKLKGV